MRTSPWGNSYRVRVFILLLRRVGHLEKYATPALRETE